MMTEEQELIELLNKEGYSCIMHKGERGYCGIHRLLFTFGIVYGLDEIGYHGRYCYATMHEAVLALLTWDGNGDPPGNWIVNKGERGGDRYNPNHPNYKEDTKQT